MRLKNLDHFGVIPLETGFATNPAQSAFQGGQTTDAAGESYFAIGSLFWATGPGTSKVVSAAGGGKIWWRTATVAAFANGSTNLRIGIQDVSGATGLEDATFDVYADLVGGTDTVSSNTLHEAAMETGTKTITHGDKVAVGIEMTARGGADSVQIQSFTAGRLFPYASADTGSGPAKAQAPAAITVQADDGTIGWIEGTLACDAFAVVTYGSGSTPDERGLIVSYPFPVRVAGFGGIFSAIASGDDFEVICYSDPLGTPTARLTYTGDPDCVFNTGTLQFSDRFSSTPYYWDFKANEKFAITLRPTTTATIALLEMTFGSGNSALRTPLQFGPQSALATRTDNSGAFTETDTTVPWIWPMVSAFSSGTRRPALRRI